jgi:hypothetical protein
MLRTLQAFILLTFLMSSSLLAALDGMYGIERLEMLPKRPTVYEPKDWGKAARSCYKLIFDHQRQGEHLPIMSIEHSEEKGTVFALKTYVGRHEEGKVDNEALVSMGAVLGASRLNMLDDLNSPIDLIDRLCVFFDEDEGIFLNNLDSYSGETFWYDLYPNVLAMSISLRHPEQKRLGSYVKKSIETLSSAVFDLSQKNEGIPDFRLTGYSFKDKREKINGRWIEPDGAAGIAWICYMGWKKYGDDKYLRAAELCMDFLDRYPNNSLYEVLLPYGTYVAARMNAECGKNYQTQKLFSDMWGPSDNRYAWGMLLDERGPHELSGLMGSTLDFGGYGFAMNTYVYVDMVLSSLVYDPRPLDLVSKWVLNATHNSKAFYGDGLPKTHQTCREWLDAHDTDYSLAYEGVGKTREDGGHYGAKGVSYSGLSPVAMGDPLLHGWAKTDIGIYGSAYIGLMSSRVMKSSNENIAAFRCSGGDLDDQPFITNLYYHHGDEDQMFIISDGEQHRLYDQTQNTFLDENKVSDVAYRYENGAHHLLMKAGESLLLSFVPQPTSKAKDRITFHNGKTMCGAVVLDYNNGSRSKSTKKPSMPFVGKMESELAKIQHQSIRVDGDLGEWISVPVTKTVSNTKGQGITLKISWSEQGLNICAIEHTDEPSVFSAENSDVYRTDPWKYDGFSLVLDYDNSNDLQQFGDAILFFMFSDKTQQGGYAMQTQRSVELVPDRLPNSKVMSGMSKGKRVVEATLNWRDLADLVDAKHVPKGGILKALYSGKRMGCDPVSLIGGWNNRAYLNGGRLRPSDRGPHSLDLSLSPDR